MTTEETKTEAAAFPPVEPFHLSEHTAVQLEDIARDVNELEMRMAVRITTLEDRITVLEARANAALVR